MDAQQFTQQLINGLALGSLYGLIAIGYTMVYGILRLINFAHGDIMMVGCYIAFYGMAIFSLPWWASFLLAIVLTALFGVLIDLGAYRPVRHAPRISALITAIGVSFLLENLGLVIFGGRPKAFATPEIFANIRQIGELRIPDLHLVTIAVTIVLLAFLYLILYRTNAGRAMRCIALDIETTKLMGVNVNRIIALTFAIGSAAAAAGGILWAMKYPQINPLMGILPGLKGFIAAVLGGIGNVTGAMLGGLLLGVLEILTVAIRPDLAGYPRRHGLCRPDRHSLFLADRTPRKTKYMNTSRIVHQGLTLVALFLLTAALCLLSRYGSNYHILIATNCAIFMALAVSYNLVNGIVGQFSLGPNAFLALGAYTSALLTLSPLDKEMSFIIDPVMWPFSVIQLPFLPSLLIGGLVAALFAFLIGFPVFRVRGDYLAIVTLGFGEVVRVCANNAQSITNGPLGLKGITQATTLWWAWGVAIVTVFLIARLARSSYGMAMKAVRYDEEAAEAIGINAFRHKLLAFVISAFFTGIGGGLLAHLITTISPSLFSFFLTFNLLIIVVLGGLGSTTGACLAAVIVTVGGEALRLVEEPFSIGVHVIPGIPGMRMVIFSFLLIVLMIFARHGLMGTGEFSWSALKALFNKMIGRKARAADPRY